MILYILEPGMSLKKSGGKLIVKSTDDQTKEYPIETVENVVLSTKCQITSQCLESLHKTNTGVSWISASGRLVGSFHNPNSIHILRQRQQFKILDNEAFRLQISKSIIRGKTQNQRVCLQRENKKIQNADLEKIIDAMKNYMKKIDQASDRNELSGIEGYLARMYFDGIRLLIPENFHFSKRSKRPPKDPVSALLGFLYSLLFNEVYLEIYHTGCNVYVGVMHELKQGHPALVSDLMEEWRAPVADTIMLRLIQNEQIGLEDFLHLEDGSVYLKQDAQKTVLHAFLHKLHSRYSAESINGIKNDYKNAIKAQIYRFIHAIETEDPSEYRPICTK